MAHQSIRCCVTFLSLSLALAASARGQSMVYVLESGRPPLSCSAGGCHGPTVHLINAATGHELAKIETAPQERKGTSLRLSSNGALLFVTDTSQFATSDTSDQLSIVDAVTKTVLARVAVGPGAADVAVLPDGSRAYVVNTGGNSVSVVDLSSFTLVAAVAVQAAPARIVAAPNGSAVYVTNAGSGTVSKISTTNNSVAATIAVGTSPAGIDISPDGSRIFVANSGSQTVTVIDAALDSALRVLPAGSGSAPPQDVSAQSASRVYVTLSDATGGTSAVQLLNAADGAVIGSAAILSGARLARDSSGTPAYVVESGLAPGSALKLVAADGTSVTTIASGNWTHAAVLTDPCAFEATATATVFGPSGGSGILTIPAPAGCAWTIDPSGYPGLSVASPLSGSGTATRAFTVSASTTPRLGALSIGRQSVIVEQTVPRMNVDFAPGTSVQQEPFTITGWAIDENAVFSVSAFPDSGIDAVHVWAYPMNGAAPILVGGATYGLSRLDVVAMFGFKYLLSGFNITVRNLPTGTYNLVFYAHSKRSNSFSNAQVVTVAVQQAPALIAIDAPAAGTVRAPFAVGGWAIDPAGSGTGVDAVHIWAYPSAGAPQFLGAATYGSARPDVGAFFGSAFVPSGFNALVTLTPGTYTLVVFAHSTLTGQFTARTVAITVAPSNPQMAVDVPAASAPAPVPPGGVDPGTRLSNPFTVGGWALDLASVSGSGVDAVHVWAYPVSGAAPMFVGAATFGARPDVGSFYGAQFAGAGFSVGGATLPVGTYDLVVFARSTVAGTFNNVRVIRITVQ